jgi:hypothetical protein
VTAFLNLAALFLPLLGGLALGTFEDYRGAVLAALSLLLAAAFQGAAQLRASPWDDFQGMDGDD